MESKKIITSVLLMMFMILSICGAAVATDYPDTDFRIEIRDAATTPKEGRQGETVKYYLDIENIGEEGLQKIECGIYTEDQIRSWGIPVSNFLAIIPWIDKVRFGIEDVENCKTSETNVDTISVPLNKGQVYDGNTKFELVVPYTDPSDDYVVFCDAFKVCYGEVGFESVNNRVTDYDLIKFDVLDAGKTTETCSDGILNQDESDTDCGGRCDDCKLDYICKADSDCESENCVSGRCKAESSDEGGNGSGDGDDEDSGDGSNGGDKDSFDLTEWIKDYWYLLVGGILLLIGGIVFVVVVLIKRG